MGASSFNYQEIIDRIQRFEVKFVNPFVSAGCVQLASETQHGLLLFASLMPLSRLRPSSLQTAVNRNGQIG